MRRAPSAVPAESRAESKATLAASPSRQTVRQAPGTGPVPWAMAMSGTATPGIAGSRAGRSRAKDPLRRASASSAPEAFHGGADAAGAVEPHGNPVRRISRGRTGDLGIGVGKIEQGLAAQARRPGGDGGEQTVARQTVGQNEGQAHRLRADRRGRGQGQPGRGEAQQAVAPVGVPARDARHRLCQRVRRRGWKRGQDRADSRERRRRNRSAGQVGQPPERHGAGSGGHDQLIVRDRENRAGSGARVARRHTGVADQHDRGAGVDLRPGERVPVAAEVEGAHQGDDLFRRAGEVEPRGGRRPVPAAEVGALVEPLRHAGGFTRFQRRDQGAEAVDGGAVALGVERQGGLARVEIEEALLDDVALVDPAFDHVPGHAVARLPIRAAPRPAR